jgi:2-methylisocitrate lyase-like PEP mutase family enzyme
MKNPEAYERFAELHARSQAFIMPNAWDGGSAVLLAQAGFESLGSSSFAIAAALGRHDSSAVLGRTESIANAALLAQVTGLPVNGDLADGYGPTPEDCVATVEAAIESGLAGLGIEDTTTTDPANPIHEFDHAVARIRAAAKAAKGRILLTGRTDNFLCGRPDLEDTIRRLTAFAEAGADVLYAPLLPDMNAILAVIRAVSPKPVNVLIGPGVTLAELQEAGVRRVSLGSALYLKSMSALVEAAHSMREGNLPAAVKNAVRGREIMALLKSPP